MSSEKSDHEKKITVSGVMTSRETIIAASRQPSGSHLLKTAEKPPRLGIDFSPFVVLLSDTDLEEAVKLIESGVARIDTNKILA